MANAEQQLHLAQTGTTLRSCSNAMHSSLLRLLALLAALATLSACASTPQPASPPQPKPKPKTYFSLGLHGYNYTDHYIDSYEVNGTGGGNVYPSTATAGGSGTTCCTGWRVGEPLPKKYTIRWTAQSCRYEQINDVGEHSDWSRSLWREQEVWFKASDIHVDADSTPSSFETHFYPDGHVELAVVSHSSPPRLILPRDPATGRRPGVPYWPDWCTSEQITQPGYPNLYNWHVLPNGHVRSVPLGYKGESYE